MPESLIDNYMSNNIKSADSSYLEEQTFPLSLHTHFIIDQYQKKHKTVIMDNIMDIDLNNMSGMYLNNRVQ